MSKITDELTRKPTEEEREYYGLEIKYEKTINKKSPKNDNLYPLNWGNSGTLKKRIEILKEAIEKECTLIETNGYLDIIEGVRANNEDTEDTNKAGNNQNQTETIKEEER